MKIVIPIDRKEDEPWFWVRGGSWDFIYWRTRVAFRGVNDPSGRGHYDVGLRIVRNQK